MDGWRFIAARALTGEILEWDLPLQGVEFSRALSASPSLKASIKPGDRAELLMATADDGLPLLDYWSTAIYAEDPSGTIRFGGVLVQPSRKGAEFSFECTGYLGWLARQLYVGERIAYKGGDYADPCGALGVPGPTAGVVRTVVQAAQAFPDANMGIVVDGATKSRMRVGSAKEPLEFNSWEHPSIGEKIIEIAGTSPGFDLIESHAWANPDDPEDGAVTHRLTLYYPRAGRRRDDLTFRVGVNIAVDEPEVADGDEYANVVVGDGAGEGSKAIRETYPRRDGRPRVMTAVDVKHLTSRADVQSATKAEAERRTAVKKIDSIQVLDHENARLGSWDIGDDAFVSILGDWGGTEGWFRITGDSWKPEDANVASVSLAPADSYQYGAAV